MKARGYCVKLPEDKRVNIAQLLGSSRRYPREKTAGPGFPASCPSRFMFCNTRAADGAKTSPPRVPDRLLFPCIQAPLDPQTIVRANQNDLATHGGEEEQQKGRDLALLQLQPRVQPPLGFLQPSSGCGLQLPTRFQKVFVVHGRGCAEIIHRGPRHPCESPQQGLLSGHASKSRGDTGHGSRHLVPFHGTAIANVYFSAFSQFT